MLLSERSDWRRDISGAGTRLVAEKFVCSDVRHAVMERAVSCNASLGVS